MIKLINGEALEELDKLIEQGIKVDAIITDIPYGLVNKKAGKRDEVIPFNKMWDRLLKIRKDKTTPIILFGQQPFTSHLILSNEKMFKYVWTWDKILTTGFLNAKKQPLRRVEDICVFYEKQCLYNPQMWEGKPLHHSKGESNATKFTNNNYGEGIKLNGEKRKFSTEKYPQQIIRIQKPKSAVNKTLNHPTEKPVELMKYLIKTYTNEGQVVLDFTMGSGSTGVAALELNRKFVGIELDENYYKTARERLNEGRKND